MDIPLSSLSDDELTSLLKETGATIRAVGTPNQAVFDRLHRFNQLFASLPAKPEGFALIYQEPG